MPPSAHPTTRLCHGAICLSAPTPFIVGKRNHRKRERPMHRKTLAVFAMAAATLGLAATLLPATTALAAPAEAQRATVHQLRIYDVPIQNGHDFHDRFRDHSVRILARHGFNLPPMRESRSDNQKSDVEGKRESERGDLGGSL